LFLIVVDLATFGTARAEDPRLSYAQQEKLRLARLDMNTKGATVRGILEGYATIQRNPDLLVPSHMIKNDLDRIADLEKCCNRIISDFAEVSMPVSHSEVKQAKAWAEETLKNLKPVREHCEVKLPEMERIADPKSYPELEQDHKTLGEIVEEYENGLFWGDAEDAAQRIRHFPKVKAWRAEKFKQYRSYMILNGGKANVMHRLFERSAAAAKRLEDEAFEFIRAVEKDVPALLTDAENLASDAAAQAKVLAFTGGVKQKLDQVRKKIALWEALTGETSPLWQALEASQAKIDETGTTLKKQILAEARVPKESYSGVDMKLHRKGIIEEWKRVYPDDVVLEVRLFGNWERKTEWREVGKSQEKVDMSYLYARVIVKTSDEIATVYVAIANKNHMKDNEVSYGVHTKKGMWVVEKVLIENLSK
jgi:hypothetical protein